MSYSQESEYGWFYDLECPPDRAAVEYQRVRTLTNRFAYRVRYNRLVVSAVKITNDEFIPTECVVPSSDIPHIIEIQEPNERQPRSSAIPIKPSIRPNQSQTGIQVQVVGSIVAGAICYGVFTC